MAIGKPVALLASADERLTRPVHFDDHHAAIIRVDRKLDVRPARIDADFAQNGNRGVARNLVFLVRQSQRGRNRNAVARMYAHRIDVFDRTDNDAVVVFIANDFGFVFLPAEHRFFDQNLVYGTGGQASGDNLGVFRAVIGHASARAGQPAGTDDDRQADPGQRFLRFGHRMDIAAFRAGKADFIHRVAE